MSKSQEVRLNIDGMHCAGCVANIERGVKGMEGVADCRVNLATRSAVVEFDDQAATPDRIITRIEELGYGARIGRPDILTANAKEQQGAARRFRLALIMSVPLMLLAMAPMLFGGHLFGSLIDGVIEAVLAALILFFAGRGILVDALKQTRHFRANMNTLIAMGTLAAWFWSAYALFANVAWNKGELLYFDSAGMIVTLILLGRFLEAKSKGKAGEAIQALIKLQPAKTTAVINNVEVEIDAAAAQPGMLLRVKPGERIPADGHIVDGAPTIDESMLTGESIPVEKSAGDQVIGGSLNGNAAFSMTVTATGSASFLARVIKLVSEAQEKKAPVQRLADNVAGIFVPVVLLIAVATGIAWAIFDPGSEMMVRSVISVLIIACPCALGLATPTAIMAGTGRAARDGIIIRGGDTLERLTRVDTVLFDKTGTLTHGELEVVDMRALNGIPDDRLLDLVGSAESQSEHPIGQALTRYMRKLDRQPVDVSDVQARPGFGLTATVDGKKLLVGNIALMEAEQVDLDSTRGAIDEELARGRTVVMAALDREPVGLFAVADRLRADTRDVITALKRTMKVSMISGDSTRTAEGVARAAGLDSFEAEIKPDQKQIIVDSYRRAGGTVAMVGDGINDAPALAAADVGIAIGSGTEVAIEASDVVLVRSELATVLNLFTVAHKSMRVIKQNLFWAFAYNVVAIPIAAGLLYPVFGLTLSPMIAAAAMAFSSVFVVTNSIRLNRVTLPH